jgi:hypothetical protein
MDKIVRLENVGVEKYGRLLCDVFVEDTTSRKFRYDRVRVCGCVYGVVRDARCVIRVVI